MDARTVEDILDWNLETVEGLGRLLVPATIDGKPEPGLSKVISALFLAEEPPRLVLVQAGGWLLLTDRERWPEGRWLAVDLATAAERKDTRSAGELETIAALVGSDGLLPREDGSCGLDAVLEDSVKHAVGVSKDLREGVRESVELVANEIVVRRRRAGLPVDGLSDLPLMLQKQALRFLYRILFLLYAEARPELEIVPAKAPEYAEGYGLDRLRDLALVELTERRSLDGTHLYESLHKLFQLVDQGHEAEDDGLPFEALRADLFAEGAISLIDAPSNVDDNWDSERSELRVSGVGLGNQCLQTVLRKLLLSKPTKGRDAGFVSYAQLGINQLGAVYEGLMSYTGFLAEEDLYEVAKGGDPSKGTWVVNAKQAQELPGEVFVRDEDPETGEPRRRLHRKGTFVYRLSGRERQRSASYYTPEVLTRCVVKHSLAELLDQDGQRTPAQRILEYTVCEPALGSGAFLIEAVNQLAEEYLKRRQEELDKVIEPERYALELQRVKAYLSLHQCYGVDLNGTAVELAEVSLWLNAMHAGLKAPWFGLHLRRGNSLIGGRRAVYDVPPKKSFKWLDVGPTALPINGDVPLGALGNGKVHHFLLPAKGWGAVADTKEAKELVPDQTATLKNWRSAVRKAPNAKQRMRLHALARRVEALWSLAAQRLEIAEKKISRQADVWEAPELARRSNGVTREQVEEFLADENNSYRRLRRAMDAWCALWFWPTTADCEPPDWEDWLDGLEALLGQAGRVTVAEKHGQQTFFDGADWAGLDEAEAEQRDWHNMRDVHEALAWQPWLRECERIADKEGFFHWELDFAPVFAAGGFDLQVGNPPWVRPDWEDDTILAEKDPWFTFNEKADVTIKDDRRGDLLDSSHAGDYLVERSSNAGILEHLGSGVDRSVLMGLRPDLYRCFMERAWRSMRSSGIVGLIHPESHFTEARAGEFRRVVYRRLRRHWQFRNERRLFEILNTREFGVHVYGAERPVAFKSMFSLYYPDTIDRSLEHDGSGPEPGIKDEDDEWDVRPHRGRIVEVDRTVLAGWSALIDEPGTPADEARMVRPVNTESQAVLLKLAAASRFGSTKFYWTPGWNETTQRKDGYFVRRSDVVERPEDVILQGPHFSVANPLARQPRPSMRNAKDYEEWDLEAAGEWALPRTSYQRAKPLNEYLVGYPHWDGKPSNESWRIVWRRMADSSTVRTLHAALVPPGPTHVNTVLAMTAGKIDLACAAAFWASLAGDFLIKVSGATELKNSIIRRLPHVRNHPLEPELILRALRLNCLTRYYEPFWQELFDDRWREDFWTHDRDDRPTLGDVRREWEMGTPLRVDFDRRQALVEIDALAAIMLDITAEELCTIYRTQFGVLRKYEREMRFDANGRQVPKDVVKEYAKHGAKADLGRYVLPFTGVDREKDMTRAHEAFTERLRTRT